MEKLTCSPNNAPKFLDWIANRGGIAVWNSINLSNLGQSWSTPALTEDGKPYPKPTWQADNSPYRIVASASDVIVQTAREIKRFHVAVRSTGPFGATFKCTDGSSRKIHTQMDKARKTHPDAWYEFDYETQDCCIMAPDKSIPLDQWHDGLTVTSRDLFDRLMNRVDRVERKGWHLSPSWILSRAEMHFNGKLIESSGNGTWPLDPRKQVFVTADGYTLTLELCEDLGYIWTDGDLVFVSDHRGVPLDSDRNPIEGNFTWIEEVK